jgi:adenylate cyclase
MSSPKAQRRLAAILAADVVGYSGLMGEDEEGTLARIKDLRREVIEPRVKDHEGRVFKTTGDGFLAEFSSPVEAVRCALDVQDALRSPIAQDTVKRLQLRIGVNLGDIIIDEDGDIYGDGVNVAARLEQLAEPGGISVSGAVYDQIDGKVDQSFEDRGIQQVKNIAKPIRVYALSRSVIADADGPSPSPLPVPDKPSIAVLPFTNMSGDPDQEYFADGITEEVTTALARLRGFFVIARNSAFTYKGKTVRVEQIGRDLGVRYVLEGSVRRSGGQIRIGVQLADATTGREVWTERYERALEDVFALQDEVAGRVVLAVEPKLYAAEGDRIQQKRPDDLDAWDCVIRALPHMWQETRAGHETALNLFSDAIRLDPTYSRALGLHAWISLWQAHHGWSGTDLASVLPAALERARFAARIDGDDAWARLALGFAQMLQRKHDDAVEELHTALDLNPNFALANACLGLTLAYGGKGAEAVAQLERAIRLSPRDPFSTMFAGIRCFAAFVAGDYASGLEWGRRAVRQSDLAGHWRGLALNAAMLGLVEEAKEALANAVRLQPSYSVAWVERASPLVSSSDRVRYCEILRPMGLPEVPGSAVSHA